VFDWLVYHFGDLFLSLRNLLVLGREICLFSKRRFLSLWGQYFVLTQEIRLFSFSYGGRFGDGLVRVLFQVERVFFFGALFFPRRWVILLFLKIFWILWMRAGEVTSYIGILTSEGEVLWESGSSRLAIHCWAWSQTCCERGSSPGERHLESESATQ
jgi:hypothetical protein